MTYQVKFREGKEPDWYVKAYDIACDNRSGFVTWTNVWDNYYPNTELSFSDRNITVTFESEQAFTMFLLRWS